MVATSPMRRALTILALLPALGVLALGCRTQAGTGAAASSGAAATRASGQATPQLGSRETCFILRELGGPRQIRKGDAACARRLPPASTFKIPHALIALETGARSGPEDLEQWDGTDLGLAVWNRGQTLGSAIQHSVVWYFQRTATRIGRDLMTKHLARIPYGNAIVGADITRFWIDGSLQITADEQADFMERLLRRSLPFKVSIMDTIDGLILQEPGTIMRGDPFTVDVTWDASTKLFAKTGSHDGNAGNVRWLVGHVDSPAGHRTSNGRGWVFVSLVASREELSTDAIVLAMRELESAGIVRPRASRGARAP
jgi:beta-lactamase class D